MRKTQRRLSIIILLTFSFFLIAAAQSPPAAVPQAELSQDDIKEALKNWVALCAPCHSTQATGTEFGPPLLGENAKRRFTPDQLVEVFAHPEDHGLSEAAPALRKLASPQRERLANWFAKLVKPEDIVVEANMPSPAPFIFVQNCSACHGPDARGGIGPNLHNIAKRRSREIIIKLIENPRRVGIKTNIMPSFEELSQEERSQIADWLLTLE